MPAAHAAKVPIMKWRRPKRPTARPINGVSIATELVRRGYVVVVIDMFYWGDRRMLLDDDPADWQTRPASMPTARMRLAAPLGFAAGKWQTETATRTTGEGAAQRQMTMRMLHRETDSAKVVRMALRATLKP